MIRLEVPTPLFAVLPADLSFKLAVEMDYYGLRR